MSLPTLLALAAAFFAGAATVYCWLMARCAGKRKRRAEFERRVIGELDRVLTLARQIERKVGYEFGGRDQSGPLP